MAELKESNKVSLKELQIDGKRFLQFDFKGHLDVDSAAVAIENWKVKVSANSKTDLIYNCLEMTGFDTPARKLWQTAMTQLKPNTGSIWIVSTNAFILGAAKTMGLLSGYNIKIAKSIDGVKA